MPAAAQSHHGRLGKSEWLNHLVKGSHHHKPLCAVQAKKAYEKASEEGEAAMHTLEKADNDPNSTKAKIDKVRR